MKEKKTVLRNVNRLFTLYKKKWRSYYLHNLWTELLLLLWTLVLREYCPARVRMPPSSARPRWYTSSPPSTSPDDTLCRKWATRITAPQTHTHTHTHTHASTIIDKTYYGASNSTSNHQDYTRHIRKETIQVLYLCIIIIIIRLHVVTIILNDVFYPVVSWRWPHD